MNRLMSAAETAGILYGDEKKTDRVYRLAREGIIPCVRLGRQLRFSPKKVEEFIENGGQALPGGWRKEG